MSRGKGGEVIDLQRVRLERMMDSLDPSDSTEAVAVLVLMDLNQIHPGILAPLSEEEITFLASVIQVRSLECVHKFIDYMSA